MNKMKMGFMTLGCGVMAATTLAANPYAIKNIAACEYVNSLAAQQQGLPSEGRFQLLEVYASTGGGKDKNAPVAKQNLALIPHVRWGLGQLSTNSEGQQRKPIDMPSIDAFLAMAKKSYEAGELPWYKWKMLQSANAVGANGTLRNARNSAVIERIEEKLPGILSAKEGDFTKSKVYADFSEANGKVSRRNEDFSKFGIWQKSLPLYNGGFTAVRAEDIKTALDLISRASEKKLSRDEQVCAWLLRERFLAQMISFTGSENVPEISTNGLLKTDAWVSEGARSEAIYPVVSVPNSLGQFVNEEWVVNRMNGTVDLRQEFTNTSDLLALLQFSASLIQNRSESLWVTEGNSGGYLLPLTLLKLGFGTLGVALKNLSENHLQVLPGGRIQLRDNSHENLVSLAWTSLWVSRSLKSLRNPNVVEREALSANQMQSLLEVQGRLYQLFTGTVIEALARRRQSRTEIEVLYQFLLQAGDVLDNDYLRNLPRKPATN